MAINGKTVLICLVGSHAEDCIAGTRSLRISTEAETIEVASVASGEWREFIAGRKSWSASCDELIASATAVSIMGDTTDLEAYPGLLSVGVTYNIYIVSNAGVLIASGTAVCTKCNVEAVRGSLVRGSFEFKGTGELA